MRNKTIRFLFINVKWTVNGMFGAPPVHAVRLVEEENNGKRELSKHTRRTVELRVLEKIYKK